MSGHAWEIQATLPIAAEQYYVDRDTAAFRALLSKCLKLGLLSYKDAFADDNEMHVLMGVKPEFEKYVPNSGNVRSPQLEYSEFYTFQRHRKCAPYTIQQESQLPAVGDAMSISSTITINAAARGECVQEEAGSTACAVDGLGSVVEHIAKDNIQQAYKVLPEVVNRWMSFCAEAKARGAASMVRGGKPTAGSSWMSEELIQLLQGPIGEQEEDLEEEGLQRQVSTLSEIVEQWRWRDSCTERACESDALKLEQLKAPQRPVDLDVVMEQAKIAATVQRANIRMSCIVDEESAELQQLKEQWRRFGEDFVHWFIFWDSLGVPEATIPHLPSRIAHLLEIAQGGGWISTELVRGPSTPPPGIANGLNISAPHQLRSPFIEMPTFADDADPFAEFDSQMEIGEASYLASAHLPSEPITSSNDNQNSSTAGPRTDKDVKSDTPPSSTANVLTASSDVAKPATNGSDSTVPPPPDTKVVQPGKKSGVFSCCTLSKTVD